MARPMPAQSLSGEFSPLQCSRPHRKDKVPEALYPTTSRCAIARPSNPLSLGGAYLLWPSLGGPVLRIISHMEIAAQAMIP